VSEIKLVQTLDQRSPPMPVDPVPQEVAVQGAGLDGMSALPADNDAKFRYVYQEVIDMDADQILHGRMVRWGRVTG
jgi:hypothetical protein